MKLLFSHWMRELDSRTIHEVGIPSVVLMENASKGAVHFFSQAFTLEQYKNAVILVGKGNNGGDGLAIGRMLWQKGYRVEFVLFTSPENFYPDPKTNFDIIRNLNLPFWIIHSVDELKGRLDLFFPHETFIVDAVLGTGIDKPVKDTFYSPVFQAVNSSGFKIAAVDLPSGLSEKFLPEDGDHIIADITVTFQCPKLSHVHPDGNKYCGEVKVVDIGIPRNLFENKDYYIELIHPNEFKDLFDVRDCDAHKGNFGHCLNISGSREKPGAGILGSFAVLKSGAGLCTMAVEEENRAIAVQSHPEIMVLIYKDFVDISQRLAEFNSILIGPGLGDTKRTRGITRDVFRSALAPVVLDADSLSVFQDNPDFLKEKKDFPVVLTPHPGEFSRLTGISIPEIQKNRIALSRDFAIEYKVYLILKGHHTLIATPEGKVFLNETGNAGMATAGSGDVLSGIITGMIAQFYPDQSMEKILQASVFIHGFAGDLAKAHLGEMGMTATDILEYVPRAFLKYNDFKTQFPFSN